MRRCRCFRTLALVLAVLALAVACKNRSKTADVAAGADSQAVGPNANAQPSQALNQTLTVPEGTTLQVRLLDPIGSATDTSGETFRATLDAPIVVNGAVAVPKDANVTGKVLVARPSGHLQTPAELVVTLTSLEAGGSSYQILTSDDRWRARSHKKRNAELIGGGAAVGALVGALVGHGKGAAIGAGIGAGGGTGTAYATGKKDITFPAETRLSFVLRRPVALPIGG